MDKKRKNEIDSLLKIAEQPSKEAMRLHPLYKGKVQIAPKVPVRDFQDFAIWYTPGVAKVCEAIKGNKEKVYEYTNKGNTIAIISDATRILGLGNIGPEAGLPVMEGKALLFKYLGGVDAIPLCINTNEMEEIISFCKWISPSLGGINIEDIEKPKCFYLLNRLRDELQIPVFHDDQQGTATIVLAGLINALRVVGKDLTQVHIAMIGTGSANTAILKLLQKIGVNPGNIVACDRKGILNKDRADEFSSDDPKHEIATITNAGNLSGGMKEALKDEDVCIAFSKSGPGVIKPKWISSMNRDAIVFACANPTPEIWPWEAKEAGAKIVATGRSDFPNQVNNSLGFPAIFRGTLDVRAKKITDEMCIAAAKAIANFVYKKGANEDYIVPTMDEEGVFVEEALAVAKKAIEQGVAQSPIPDEELKRRVTEKIESGKKIEKVLVDSHLIKNF